MVNEHSKEQGMQGLYKKWACKEPGCGFAATTKERYNHMLDVHGFKPQGPTGTPWELILAGSFTILPWSCNVCWSMFENSL